jgi:3-hydroxyacyl-[acyl-carrier-protein] dehydratase
VSDSLTRALELLPHGSEFRFLDQLLTLNPGQTGSAELRVKGDEPFLRGHFPGQPLFPGVLLIEAGAQLAGVVAQSDPSRLPLAGLKLTAVRAAKITGSARPGEVVRITARVTGRLGNLVQAEIQASVSGRIVLEGVVALSGEEPGAAPLR